MENIWCSYSMWILALTQVLCYRKIASKFVTSVLKFSHGRILKMGENFHRYWTQWETGNPSTANLGLLSDGIEVQVTYQTTVTWTHLTKPHPPFLATFLNEMLALTLYTRKTPRGIINLHALNDETLIGVMATAKRYHCPGRIATSFISSLWLGWGFPY